MSTATPAIPNRPAPGAPPRGAPMAPAVGGVAIDPIRLLKKYYPLLIAASVLGGALGAAAHFVLAQVAPQYESFAIFEIRPQAVRYTEAGGAFQSQDELLRFQGTQMATITSSLVLERTSRDSKVEDTAWAKQFFSGGSYQSSLAQIELERRVQVRPIAQSNLMRVSFSWKNPEDVRSIVQAVTKNYLDDISRQERTKSVQQRDLLTQQITLLDGQIRDLNTSRDRIMQDNEVPNLGGQGDTTTIKVDRLSSELVQILTAREQARTQLKNFLDRRDQPVRDYPEMVQEIARRDATIQSLDAQISSTKTDMQTLRAQGYGAEHLTVIAIRKRLEVLEVQREEAYKRELDKALDSTVESLKLQNDSLSAQFDALSADLATVQKRQQDLSRVRLRLDEIDRDIRQRSDERAGIDSALKNLTIVGGGGVFDRVRLLVEAQRPTVMSFPKLTILVPIGVLLVGSLAAGVVLLRELFDQRVRGPSDLMLLSRLRVLGMIPDASEDPARPANLATAFKDSPRGVTTESYRLLRAPIAKAMDQHAQKTLLVLGSTPGSGATTVVCNLALASAGAEERTLIIDANLRRPAIHRVFNLPDGPGLGDCLAGMAKLEDCIRPTGVENLSVLSAGSPGNRAIPERLGGEGMARLLGEACGKFDRIIVDSAPAIVSGDGLALANRVHASCLVVKAMAEKRGLVNRLRNALGETRSEFLGVVVNAVRASAGGYLRGNIKATHEYQSANSSAT